VEFLAILIAVAVMRLRGTGAPLQQDGWFFTLRGLLAGKLSGNRRHLALILLPALGALLLQVAVHGRFYGALDLVFFVLVLIYSCGRGNLAQELAAYLQRWNRGDFHAAYRQLATDPAMSLSDDGSVADPVALHELARRRLYYRGFERLFAALFWFFFLGPAGAIAYRSAVLASEAARVEGATGADSVPLRWLEWLPVRICGLVFALVGDFDKGLYAWQRVVVGSRIGTADALDLCGNAALGIQAPAAAQRSDELIVRGTCELQSVLTLGNRALVVWLVIMGLLAMIF
jgi:AmpE protein